MSFALPNGAHLYLAATYEPELIITDISNAEEAVLTVDGKHTIQVGDVVQLKSGWSALDNMVAKVSKVADMSITLGNVNTTNKGKFAVGGGAGSLKKIKSWIELPQITEVANSGGDQQTVQVQFLSDDSQRNLNTFKAAASQTYTIAHDSSLPVYDVLREADDNGDTLAAYMFVPKAKENRYWSATVSFNETPTMAVNAVETVSVVLNLQSNGMTFYKVA
ncbi:phage tail protein [Pragia fontium]|uniref:phage tail protein n=1 Tax=Pragia fontium TaxID=82985 RepID=UPI000649491D|nr:phage tail protein [Pragia fontium]AKJ41475.1 phage tail protein [Pragia fontium]